MILWLPEFLYEKACNIPEAKACIRGLTEEFKAESDYVKRQRLSEDLQEHPLYQQFKSVFLPQCTDKERLIFDIIEGSVGEGELNRLFACETEPTIVRAYAHYYLINYIDRQSMTDDEYLSKYLRPAIRQLKSNLAELDFRLMLKLYQYQIEEFAICTVRDMSVFDLCAILKFFLHADFYKAQARIDVVKTPHAFIKTRPSYAEDIIEHKRVIEVTKFVERLCAHYNKRGQVIYAIDQKWLFAQYDRVMQDALDWKYKASTPVHVAAMKFKLLPLLGYRSDPQSPEGMRQKQMLEDFRSELLDWFRPGTRMERLEALYHQNMDSVKEFTKAWRWCWLFVNAYGERLGGFENPISHEAWFSDEEAKVYLSPASSIEEITMSVCITG